MNIIRKNNIGIIQVFTGGAIWGTIGIFVTKMSECGADSVTISFWRMTFSFAILALFTAVKYGIKAFKTDLKTFGTCAALGLVCHGIYNIFYSVAIVRTGVTISAVLLNVAPVFTAITACILFSERMTKFKAFAIVLNILGCILAVTGGRITVRGISVTGIIFGAAAGFCYSLTAIIGRIAGSRTNPFVMSTYSYMFAALFLFVSAKPAGAHLSFSAPIAVWGFLYALIPTAIAYLIYYSGVQKIKESSKVPVYASIETVVAAILGVLINHEQIGVCNFAGIAVVIASILMMNTSTGKPGRNDYASEENPFVKHTEKLTYK